MSSMMLDEVKELGGVKIGETNDPESSAVVWFEFQRQREGKTQTLHFTLRARPNENEYDLFARAMQLIDKVEGLPYGFKGIDAEKPSWNKGGGGNKQSANVPDRFKITAVEKVARPNKNAKTGDDPNWYDLICYGEGDVQCKAFIGTVYEGGKPYMSQNSPIKKSGQFVKFFEWNVGEKMPVPADRELYAITASGKYGKEVVDIEPHASNL